MESPKSIIERAGLQYLGEQEMPRGQKPGQMFNASTGSTLMICGEVTEESVAAKLQEHDERFNVETRAA